MPGQDALPTRPPGPMPQRAAVSPPRIDDAVLLRIAQAAVRFPRSVPPGAPLSASDMDRIARRFGAMLAARFDGMAGLLRPGNARDIALDSALGAWGEGQFPGGAQAIAALARQMGVPRETGLLAAAALQGFATLPPRAMSRIAATAAGPGPGLSPLFRMLALGMRLRRPDMLEAPGMDDSLEALLDWCVVFGLSEYALWPMLPVGDRRMLLGGTAQSAPLFLRAALRFRWDLRQIADRPLLLRQWFRSNASREYGIRLEHPVPAPQVPGRISVIGPWRSVLGLADDCLSACLALEALGADWEVAATEVGRRIERDPDKVAALGAHAVAMPSGARALFTDTLFQAVFWALTHWPRYCAFERVDLFAPWELPSLPEGWALAARHLFHTIMSPSGFARDAFAAAGAPRALRVMSSVELTGRSAAADRLALARRITLPHGAPVLVTAFDFASWMERKNPEAVLAAFARLRRQMPRALLVVKTTRGREARGEARRLFALLRRRPGVIWVDGAWPNADVEALLRRADAMVSLHRAEGFGRNIAKALLLGTETVATHWSGNVEMAAEPRYGAVPPVRLVAISDADYVLGDGQHWAEPDPRAALRALRRALAPGAKRPGRAAMRFSRQRLAHRLARVLDLPVHR